MLYSCVAFFRCVRFNFFSTKPRDWLWRASPKWPILCSEERKTWNPTPIVSVFFLPAWCLHGLLLTVSSELLGFCFFVFRYFSVSVPCTRLSRPYRELSSACKYIVSYIVTQSACDWVCWCAGVLRCRHAGRKDSRYDGQRHNEWHSDDLWPGSNTAGCCRPAEQRVEYAATSDGTAYTLPAIPGTNKHTHARRCDIISFTHLSANSTRPADWQRSSYVSTLLRGGSVVGRWTCDLQVAGSNPSQSAFM